MWGQTPDTQIHPQSSGSNKVLENQAYDFHFPEDGTLEVRLEPLLWPFPWMAAWPQTKPFTSVDLSCSPAKWGVLLEAAAKFSFSPATLLWPAHQPRSYLWWSVERCCVGWESTYSSGPQGSPCLNTLRGGSSYPIDPLCFRQKCFENWWTFMF